MPLLGVEGHRASRIAFSGGVVGIIGAADQAGAGTSDNCVERNGEGGSDEARSKLNQQREQGNRKRRGEVEGREGAAHRRGSSKTRYDVKASGTRAVGQDSKTNGVLNAWLSAIEPGELFL